MKRSDFIPIFHVFDAITVRLKLDKGIPTEIFRLLLHRIANPRRFWRARVFKNIAARNRDAQ